MPRAVVLGQSILYMGVATHWGMKIDGTWYELEGANKSENRAPNKVVRSWGTKSGQGASPLVGRGLVGITNYSDSEIWAFCNQWVESHPFYNLMTSNCQTFARDLAYWACDGACDMPPMESGTGCNAQKGGAFAVVAGGVAKTRIQSWHVEAQSNVFHASFAGPKAGLDARAGEQGFGAFADACLYRAEARGPGIGVHCGLNLDTGCGVRNGNYEGSWLGWGVTIGKNGLSLNTPLIGFSFGSGRA